MSLNFYIAIGLALALLLSPLILLTAPVWVSWILWQRREQRRAGLLYLWPFMARTIANYAEAMIPADPPEIPWTQVPRNLDRYLAAYSSPRKWRILLVAFGLEFVPLLALRPPFSRMSREARRRFCRAKLRTSKGIWGKVTMGKQLIRLGYYCSPETHVRMGFTSVRERLEQAAERGTPDLLQIEKRPASGEEVRG